MALNLNIYLLDSALRDIQSKASTVSGLAQHIKNKIDTGPIRSEEIITLMRQFRVAHDALSVAKNVPGLNAYAQQEFNDALLDYKAEVEAVMAQMVLCYQWVDANFPKDANGYLLKDKIVNGLIENREFTQVQTAGLSAQLAILLAAFV
jgi:hypothetical protein